MLKQETLLDWITDPMKQKSMIPLAVRHPCANKELTEQFNNILTSMEKNMITYLAAFIPVSEGGYFICVPDIKNCFTEADTIEEAKVMAKDVIELMLSSQTKNKGDVFIACPTVDSNVIMEKAQQMFQELDVEATGPIELYPIEVEKPSNCITICDSLASCSSYRPL